MTTLNPFGKLTIMRDSDDEMEISKNTQKVTSVQNNTTSAQTVNKKKKVRPEEKKREQNEKREELEEGFVTVVKKGHKEQPRSKKNDEETVEVTKKDFNVKPKNKEFMKPRPKVRDGKRQFERISGTGRGKEIKKEGAGGKHTWEGNKKNFDDADDLVFDKVLNKETQENVVVEQEAKQEEKTEVVVEETKAEEETKVEEVKEKKEKKGNQPEVDPKDLLERPENAMTLAEYQEAQKEKNAKLNANVREVTKPEGTDSLKEQSKTEDLFRFGVDNTKKAKKHGAKEKKQDKEILFTANFEDNQFNNRGGNRKYNDKKKQQKFNFKDEEFPEL